MIRFIKKFAVFFIAALVLTFIWFKTAGAAETQDAARLEALAKRLNDFTSLEADFTQKRTLGAAGRTLTSTGTLSLTGDGAFSWVQKTPFVQTVSLKDGVFTIRYEDEAPEVMKAETHPAVLSAARLLTSVMRLDAAGRLRLHARGRRKARRRLDDHAQGPRRGSRPHSRHRDAEGLGIR